MNNFYTNLLGIRTETFQPNISNLDNRNRNDCTIRAYCKALNKTWDEVFDEVYEICKKERMMYNSSKICEKYLSEYGFKQKFTFKKYNSVGEYLYNKNGIHVVNTKYHCACYIDGVIYDTERLLENIDLFITSPIDFVMYK